MSLADDYDILPDRLEPQEEDFTKCPICGSWVHYTQDFCVKCLDEESKWKLGVL